MSAISRESIEVIAQSLGVTNLSSDVSISLASDVEYRVSEIMQEAIKCMRHARRTVLTSQDVDSALNLRNLEPVRCLGSCEDLRFKRAGAWKGLFYIEDKDIEFRKVLEAPVPASLVDPSVGTHWLAVEGVQPRISENPILEATSNRRKQDENTIESVSPLNLPKELQWYFEKISEIGTKKPNSPLFRKIALSLKRDVGLQPLLPLFTHFIANEISKNLNNISVLFSLIQFIRNLILNPHIHLEPYIHQLIPSILTCLIGRRLGSPSSNHWHLRNAAADVIASVSRFSHASFNLQPRVVRTLLHSFLDPNNHHCQHYGAVQGVSALGHHLVRLFLLPNLEAYLLLLEPELSKYEAQRVHGALIHAVGVSMFRWVKAAPIGSRLSRKQFVWKKNARVATLPQKQVNKKQGTDSGSDGSGLGSGLSSPSSVRQVSQENPSGAVNHGDDVVAGSLFADLIGRFGDGMVSFIPMQEMLVFI